MSACQEVDCDSSAPQTRDRVLFFCLMKARASLGGMQQLSKSIGKGGIGFKSGVF